MNSGLSDSKAHILISLSGKKEIKKAQEQEILPEKTCLNGASKQEAHDGRGHCVLWESATRMGDGLKGPKEISLLRPKHGSGNWSCPIKELWGRDVREIQFTFEFLIFKNC